MENTDDYDFNPSANSKLKSLFDSSLFNVDGSDLTYTAPKQPRTKEVVNLTPPAESSVICARTVQVWKLVDGKYTTCGKLGLAIIGLTVQNKYEMILYKDKQNVTVRLKINESLTVCLKKDCFISFYDNFKENWLIKFSSQSDLASIITEIEKLGATTETEIPKPIPQPETKTLDLRKLENENPTETNETQAKTDILNRIAKMGQSILPIKPTETDEDSISTDSNDTRISETQLISPVLLDHPRSRPIQHMPATTTIVGQYYDPISLLCTENRTHNSEVRMNLSQISEKLNNLMRVVDGQNSFSDSSELKSKLKVLQLKNENLERDLLKMQTQNQKLQEVAQDKSIQIALENCKTELKVERTKSEEKSKELSYEVNKNKELTDDMSKRIEALHLTVFEKDEAISQLEQKINVLQSQSDSVVLQKESDDQTCNNFKTILKASMNEMYNNIVTTLNNQPSSDVQNIIAQNIKSTTLNIMQHLERYSDKPQ